MNLGCSRCERDDNSDEGEGERGGEIGIDKDSGLLASCGRACGRYDTREDEGDEWLFDDSVWTGGAEDRAWEVEDNDGLVHDGSTGNEHGSVHGCARMLAPTSVERIDTKLPVAAQLASQSAQVAHFPHSGTRQVVAPQSIGRQNNYSSTITKAADVHDIVVHDALTMPTMVLSKEREQHQIGSAKPLPLPTPTATFGESPLPTATFGASVSQNPLPTFDSLPRSSAGVEDFLRSSEALPTFSTLPTAFSSLPTSPLPTATFPESPLSTVNLGGATTRPTLGASALPTATFGMQT